jgi:hypothetical protein
MRGNRRGSRANRPSRFKRGNILAGDLQLNADFGLALGGDDRNQLTVPVM